MKKWLSALSITILLLTTASCSFFGKKEEKGEKPGISMAMEFAKKAKEQIKQLKKEKEKEMKEKSERGESVILTDKDFEAYLKSLDYAIKKLNEQTARIEEKSKKGELGAMDILAFSINSLATVFNPDEYLDKLSDNQEERDHYEKAFGKIVKIYSFVGDKPVDQFIKENRESIENAKKSAEEMKKKIEEMKKENPELAKKLQEQIDLSAMEKLTDEANPLSMFTEKDLKLYSKYQKDVCERNNKLKEQFKKLKTIFENFKKQ